uniref:Cilia- and flagella-associated protein 157 n=2 Tax=Clastoptera arizonana TaxID=38151 RepID=A0A1B6CHV9_9HEMI
MGKKSKGGGKKTKNKEDKDVLPEVDKEFYEIQITDLNQKLSRLRSRCTDLETENEDIKNNLNKLDEDRADIIAFLQGTLQAKANEIMELEERLTALQQAKEAERITFLQKIKNMENDFKLMNEQLTSEIKLLNGKLNSLEEFRSQREELINKFLVQEEEMKEQEKRHKITLYEVERKFIVGKDELKKDMEAKLLNLTVDFQNTTEIRIAATTQRVIRENVAINNELRILLESWKKLKDSNEELVNKEKKMKTLVELHNEEKIRVMKKNAVQNKIIERLSNQYNKLKNAYSEQVNKYRKLIENRLTNQVQESQINKKEIEDLKKILYMRDVQENEHELNLRDVIEQIIELKKIIQTAAVTVQEALEISEDAVIDKSHSLACRQTLLSTLLEIFNRANNIRDYELTNKLSAETISLHRLNVMNNHTYSNGDLGLIPKYLYDQKIPEEETSNLLDTEIELNTETINIKNLGEDSLTSILKP